MDGRAEVALTYSQLQRLFVRNTQQHPNLRYTCRFWPLAHHGQRSGKDFGLQPRR
jgi:hypothetical protein